MSGLGLANAVRGYMEGQQWQQQQAAAADRQAQVAKQREVQAKVDRAKQAALQTLEESKAKWAMNGAQGEYQPSEDTHLKMAERYGAALAKEGLYDQYMENRVRTAPMVLQARGKALQQYTADGDSVKLALALGPTYFDGRDVIGAKRIGGDENGGPESVSIEFAGSEKPQVVRVDELVKGLKMGLTDPQTWLKNEALKDLEREKAKAKTAGDIALESKRGENQLALETKRGENRADVADINGQYRLDAAQIRGQYGTENARIRGEFMSLAAKARGGSGGRTSEDVQRFRALELAARSSMESIRKELAAKEARLKDAYGADKGRIQSAMEALKSELEEARGVHSEIMSTMRRPAGSGLSDANNTPMVESGPNDSPSRMPMAGAAAGEPSSNMPMMEQARAEAISTRQPVEYDLGGKRGTINPDGGLSAVATKPAASAPGKKASGKKAPEAPRDASQRKPNTVYSTPKGDLMWTGKGWKRVDG